MTTALRKLRMMGGYPTSKSFANKLGIPEMTYSAYERSGVPPARVAMRIADILGTTLDQSYGRAPIMEVDHTPQDEKELVDLYKSLGRANKARLSMYMEYLGYLEEKEKELIG